MVACGCGDSFSAFSAKAVAERRERTEGGTRREGVMWTPRDRFAGESRGRNGKRLRVFRGERVGERDGGMGKPEPCTDARELRFLFCAPRHDASLRWLHRRAVLKREGCSEFNVCGYTGEYRARFHIQTLQPTQERGLQPHYAQNDVHGTPLAHQPHHLLLPFLTDREGVCCTAPFSKAFFCI
ncbi:hypothetical protein F2P81_022131 [Scophthalmus maximus]|uniref:Uncharacterized protein n=1 Tax=Scophthalmus maximus TaxID=52904 RepID=A0A6A4S0U1_SCOMX|nr:hypothetical protein F2P81_022131 [Scophthalmus maximus]